MSATPETILAVRHLLEHAVDFEKTPRGDDMAKFLRKHFPWAAKALRETLRHSKFAYPRCKCASYRACNKEQARIIAEAAP